MGSKIQGDFNWRREREERGEKSRLSPESEEGKILMFLALTVKSHYRSALALVEG